MFVTEAKAERGPDRSPAAFQDPSRAWRGIIDPVKPFLENVAARLAEEVEAFDPEIVPYVRYALTNQGKQMRPALVALSGAAAGTLNDSHIDVAVIIEMVHLATLVHDDVMDEAEVRRRQPTLAANWGNEISVLVGDCLFAHALSLAASFPTPEICRAVASATNVVCSGEILQTHQRRNFELNRSEYIKIVGMKTAELFALSCDLGASLSGASGMARNALREYGSALGTGYQIFDDCVDVFGSESMAGKSLGTDLASGKLTLPILAVFEKACLADRTLMQELIQDWEPEHLPRVLEILERYDGLNMCRDVIGEYLDSAKAMLAVLPGPNGSAALIGLADFLSQQIEALGVT